MITDYLVDESAKILEAVLTGFGVIMLVAAIAGAAVVTVAVVEMIRDVRKNRRRGVM